MPEVKGFVFDNTIEVGQINPNATRYVDGSTAVIAEGQPEKFAAVGRENAEMRDYFDSAFNVIGLTADDPMNLEMRAALLNTIRNSSTTDFDSMKAELIAARDTFEQGAGRLRNAALPRSDFDALALKAIDYKNGIKREPLSGEEKTDVISRTDEAVRTLVSTLAELHPNKDPMEFARFLSDMLKAYSNEPSIREIATSYHLVSQGEK